MEIFDTSIVEQIEMKMIRPSQFVVRDKFHESLETESLMCSIKEHGLLQPILIRPILHGFEIVAGHRRFQACKSLRWRFMASKIRDLSDKQAFEIMLTENIQRKSMDPVEEAEAFRKYVLDFGWGGVSELARKIAKSEEYVSHRIQLLKLPEEVKDQIMVNKLNVSQALELTNVPQSRLLEFTNKIMEKNLTIKQIREVKAAIKEETLYGSGLSISHCENSSLVPVVRKVKFVKKTSLALRITLARLDNIIDEVEMTIEPEQRAELINFVMNIRLRVHSMIDETIRFKNSHLKFKTK
jgi:ParB family chromosome partitioning protein